ncbi:hypothetical protein CRV08_09665 [Halarcobacter ebronensis]|uniref:histidine kinase n=1 Tax=Halarcobacter ebronensis TaxID=1462615 RepID=A0A4Q0YBC9_9BACT|nr:ATP-binding protein [Halarcobacter ebronensis]RXJ67627.1 hypothetical protein CRV08_09665 [Halarcobacter ebronensis]
MKLRKIFFPILNPYIGPIFAISIFLSFVVFYLVPKHSYENKIEHMSKEALKTLNYLKKIRVYYTSSVLDKIDNSSVNADYNYKENYHTIPLAETLVHDLALILPSNDMKIKMYSSYPFPNRANRELNSFEKQSLALFLNNPDEIYKKDVLIDGKHSLRVAVADIMLDNSCVECHNSRADSPKRDWKINDVRGAIEIILPFEDGVLLTPEELNALMYIFIFVLVSLGAHYIVIAIIRSKDYKIVKQELEKEVAERTESLNSTVKLLNQYKKAVDFSAIVSKTDPNGKITYVNEEFIKISQYQKEELLGKNHNIVRHSDMPKSIFKELWETIKSKKIWKGQIKNRAKDGSAYYVVTTIVPLLDLNDEIEEFLAIRFNVTDIVESEMKAQSADATKSIFLANMSHEVRTPLNAIIGFSEVLSNSEKLDAKEKKQATIIQTSANSLLAIINDILDISKIESGNFEVLLDESDIYSIGEHVVELFSKKAAQKDIKLIFSIDPKIPLCIMTDSIRIRQVLSNFLSNAIKFTHEKGVVTLNISLVDISANSAKIKFEVSDSGIGIPKDKLETIFDPFIQVDNKTNRKFEGTGLGLSICKHIIEALGSSVKIESVENKGTKFYFTLDTKICTKKLNDKEEFSSKINFKISDENSELFHNIKRYLTLFGEINSTKKDIDVIVCDKSEIESFRKEYKEIPKLTIFEYESDLNSFKFDSNEIGLALPFYASKVNDTLEELLKKSQKRVFNIDEAKKTKGKKFKGRVLIAEDNSANQELIGYILTDLQIEFDIKSNGLETLEAYKNAKYDLVLMDINMPIMDGVEAFRKIRNYEENHKIENIPIVALTANAIKGDKEKFLSLGMDGYLSKPINTMELKELLRLYLSYDIDEKQQNEKETVSSKEGIDVTKIVQKLGVSENIVNLIINKFKSEIEDHTKELETAINKNDSEEVSQKAHYIKNSCLNVCLEKLCDILQKLENKKLEQSERKELFEEFQKELKKYL